MGLSRFSIDKWGVLQRELSNQIQAGVRTVLQEDGSARQEMVSKLSSIEQLLVLQISNGGFGGSSLERLSSQFHALEANLEAFTNVHHNDHVNKSSSSYTQAAGLQDVNGKLDSLVELAKSQNAVNMGQGQTPDKNILNNVFEAAARELRRDSSTKVEIRCICGTDQIKPKRPNTGSQRKQKRLLVFCDSCEAWHHGSCVGLKSVFQQNQSVSRTCPLTS